MMPIAVLLETEGLLFDTDEVRWVSLHAALSAEGVDCDADDVLRAHDGVPASRALDTLMAGRVLDATSQALVLRRAADLAADAFMRAEPRFDPDVRDHLVALAADYPIGVVTRADRSSARRLLESVGLDGCVRIVCSLDERTGAAPNALWSDTMARLHAERGVAFAPTGLVRDAEAAGLRTFEVTGLATVVASGRTTPFSLIDADVVASLFSLP